MAKKTKPVKPKNPLSSELIPDIHSRVNAVFDALVKELERYGYSVKNATKSITHLNDIPIRVSVERTSLRWTHSGYTKRKVIIRHVPYTGGYQEKSFKEPKNGFIVNTVASYLHNYYLDNRDKIKKQEDLQAAKAALAERAASLEEKYPLADVDLRRSTIQLRVHFDSIETVEEVLAHIHTYYGDKVKERGGY